MFSSFVAVQVNDVICNETSTVVSSPDGACMSQVDLQTSSMDHESVLGAPVWLWEWLTMYSISVGGMGETKKVVSDLRSSTPSVSSLLSCCSFILSKLFTNFVKASELLPNGRCCTLFSRLLSFSLMEASICESESESSSSRLCIDSDRCNTSACGVGGYYCFT